VTHVILFDNSFQIFEGPHLLLCSAQDLLHIWILTVELHSFLFSVTFVLCGLLGWPFLARGVTHLGLAGCGGQCLDQSDLCLVAPLQLFGFGDCSVRVVWVIVVIDDRLDIQGVHYLHEFARRMRKLLLVRDAFIQKVFISLSDHLVFVGVKILLVGLLALATEDVDHLLELRLRDHC
jgi:hypothetical protein